ncbi:hypothetical protein FGG47_gp22 [Mycobacterium phage Rebeuca]|uniref:Uncharacterized protein n=1 Tax=Mycobacterium phage Rebeuca TaxID=2927991 RepID=J7KFC7_9CAUD|nr:hypothetical protein FGG47_gp22 [Mycobacterium phage Rebeuca]AFQ97398.1 hypothetical protein REBEUCA_73 [Mycobacterium phage Rebeuca]
MPRLPLGVPRQHGAGSRDRGQGTRDHRSPSQGEAMTRCEGCGRRSQDGRLSTFGRFLCPGCLRVFTRRT